MLVRGREDEAVRRQLQVNAGRLVQYGATEKEVYNILYNLREKKTGDHWGPMPIQIDASGSHECHKGKHSKETSKRNIKRTGRGEEKGSGKSIVPDVCKYCLIQGHRGSMSEEERR